MSITYQSIILHPRFKLPSRWWLCNCYIPAVSKVVTDRLKSEMTYHAAHVNITTDGWTSRHGGSFQSLTIHMLINLPDEWTLETRQLEVELIKEGSHTGAVLASKVESMCKKWGISATGGVGVIATTDMGRNIFKALRHNPMFEQLFCFAHMIHNCMLEAVKNTAPLKDMLQQIINIARNLNKSDKAKISFKVWCRLELGVESPLPLSPVQNRWNSYAGAAERYIEIHHNLQSYVNS